MLESLGVSVRTDTCNGVCISDQDRGRYSGFDILASRNCYCIDIEHYNNNILYPVATDGGCTHLSLSSHCCSWHAVMMHISRSLPWKALLMQRSLYTSKDLYDHHLLSQRRTTEADHMRCGGT